MDMILVAGALLVIMLAIGFFLATRRRVARVYHVGALVGRTDLVGKKLLVYGFVKPVYGKAVKIVGFGGNIKGRCEVTPAGGAVLEGVMEKDGFAVQRVVTQLPSNWVVEWMNPPGKGSPKINK